MRFVKQVDLKPLKRETHLLSSPFIRTMFENRVILDSPSLSRDHVRIPEWDNCQLLNVITVSTYDL